MPTRSIPLAMTTTGFAAVLGVRYDANEVMQGVTEVLCYGTAVVTTRG